MPVSLFSHRSDEKLYRIEVGEFIFDAHYQPVFANRETDARSRHFRSELFRETIISAAAEDRILGAERSVDNLEGGARVVIEAAYKTRLHFKGDLRIGEITLNRLEVCTTALVEIIQDGRQGIYHRLVLRHLA